MSAGEFPEYVVSSRADRDHRNWVGGDDALDLGRADIEPVVRNRDAGSAA